MAAYNATMPAAMSRDALVVFDNRDLQHASLTEIVVEETARAQDVTTIGDHLAPQVPIGSRTWTMTERGYFLAADDEHDIRDRFGTRPTDGVALFAPGRDRGSEATIAFAVGQDSNRIEVPVEGIQQGEASYSLREPDKLYHGQVVAATTFDEQVTARTHIVDLGQSWSGGGAWFIAGDGENLAMSGSGAHVDIEIRHSTARSGGSAGIVTASPNSARLEVRPGASFASASHEFTSTLRRYVWAQVTTTGTINSGRSVNVVVAIAPRLT